MTRCLVQRAERDSKKKCMETGYEKRIPLRIRVFLFRLSLCTPILIHDVALAVPHLRPGVLCSLRALAHIHTYGPLTKRRSVKRDLTMDSPFHLLLLFYHSTVPRRALWLTSNSNHRAMVSDYAQTPFDELESWFATFKKDKVLGTPEEARIIQNTLGKQVIIFDPHNATKASTKLTRDPTWKADLALAYHTVILRLNLAGKKSWSGEVTQEDFFHHVAATLPHMRNVNELVFLDSNVDPESAAAVKDIFEGTDMPLETLWCNSDALLEKSWTSICTGSIAATLQDFRGFCDPHKALPSGTFPPIAPKLKYLETSADLAFLLKHGVPWSITHLCIHIEWRRMPIMLRRISRLRALSDRLHSLRLDCYANPSAEEESPKTDNIPGKPSEPRPLAACTPLLVCRHLRAPALRYLEVKEITSVSSSNSLHLRSNIRTPFPASATPRARRLLKTASRPTVKLARRLCEE